MLEKGHPIAVWRIDTIVGNMDEIERFQQDKRLKRTHSQYQPKPSKYGPLLVRANAAETLSQLTAEKGFMHLGFSHFDPEIMKEALQVTGLGGHFQDVVSRFEHQESEPGFVKPYKYFAHKFGLDDEEAKKRMIVLGGYSSDQPYDMPGMVQIRQDVPNRTAREIVNMDARAVGSLVSKLHSDGEGDFVEGINRWWVNGLEKGSLGYSMSFSNSREVVRDRKTRTRFGLQVFGVRVDLEESGKEVKAVLDYEPIDHFIDPNPTITVLNWPDWQKKPKSISHSQPIRA